MNNTQLTVEQIEKILTEVSEKFFKKAMNKTAKKIIHEWAADPTLDKWFFATDLLDYYEWPRRGNRVEFHSKIIEALKTLTP